MGKAQVIALALLALAIPAIAFADSLRCTFPASITIMGDAYGVTFSCPAPDPLPYAATLIMLGF